MFLSILFTVLAICSRLGSVNSLTCHVDNSAAGCNDTAICESSLAFFISPFCTIQAAVNNATDSDTVLVAPGTYNENVKIVSKSIEIISTGGKNVTFINGLFSVGFGTIEVEGTTTGLKVGTPTGGGFTIKMTDDETLPAQEAAAIRFKDGPHTGAEIRNNELIADGEACLLSEYGATFVNPIIDSNIFSGTTFIGTPAGCGFGTQFSELNVPRQLVAVSGPNTENVTFTNNEITGTAGGYNDGTSGGCALPLAQGNTLVTIDSNRASISGNTFFGTPARYGTSLRCRGPNTTIQDNVFDPSGYLPNAGNVYIVDIDDTLENVLDSNIFLPFSNITNVTIIGDYIVSVPTEVEDLDRDGVPDVSDECLDSVPDPFADSLEPNRYASGEYLVTPFVAGPNQDPSLVYNMQTTRGCTCTQILKQSKKTKSCKKSKSGNVSCDSPKGCKSSIMEKWTGISNDADDQAGVGDEN